MKKVVLIDGNNLLFRSYYATAYSGNIMNNSKGFPTNALYGFTLMINKIISEENPEYLMVAFDIGKNFRKEKYDFYKEGRSTTPDELKVQMPIARDILNAMGIISAALDNKSDANFYFSKAIEAHPNNTLGFINRCQLYKAQNDLQKALSDINAAINIDSAQPDNYVVVCFASFGPFAINCCVGCKLLVEIKHITTCLSVTSL